MLEGGKAEWLVIKKETWREMERAMACDKKGNRERDRERRYLCSTDTTIYPHTYIYHLPSITVPLSVYLPTCFLSLHVVRRRMSGMIGRQKVGVLYGEIGIWPSWFEESAQGIPVGGSELSPLEASLKGDLTETYICTSHVCGGLDGGLGGGLDR